MESCESQCKTLKKLNIIPLHYDTPQFGNKFTQLNHYSGISGSQTEISISNYQQKFTHLKPCYIKISMSISIISSYLRLKMPIQID